jgi:hypothetical protein
MRRIALALALAGLLIAAPLAQATSDPLGSGTTTLRFEPGFLAFLKKDKVSLAATAPAKLRAGALALPVAGGLIDPTTGKGQIDAGGSLVFRSSRKKVPLRNLSVKTKHSPLVAKVGGSQLKVATSAAIDSVREGFGTGFSAKALKLTAKVAERLNKKLRPKVPFSQGQKLGTLVSKTQPLTTAVLEQGRATVVFDAGFVAKLSSLFVSLNPIFPAEHQGPTFTFPIIAGGQLAPDGSEGTLRSGGDVEMLQLGAGQLLWHELWLDLATKQDSAEADAEPSPPNPGKSGRIGVFDLGPTAVTSDPAARTISVTNAPLTLSAQTAAALNQLFGAGKALFAAGEAAGTVSFVAQGQ